MRIAPRLPVKLEAFLESSEDSGAGVITDLGLKGALIQTSLEPPVDQLFILQFSLLNHQPFEVLARVVWKSATGITMEFLDLDRIRLEALCSSLAGLWPPSQSRCSCCNKPLTPGESASCPHCHFPSDFHEKDYLERFPEYTQDCLEMIGTCPAMLKVFHLIRKVALSDLPVLVTGASGTGKELVAQAIHERSLRSQGPFVAVNCGAIPWDLLESELFGHEKGAFTGAFRTVVGKVELANYGTLFLDEVGDLPLELQVKLLRFLQDLSFERVGGRERLRVNLRVISATNSDLKELISTGHFRQDLYYRLNGINIGLPDLKDRGDDLLIMAQIFLKQYASQTNKKVSGFAEETVAAMKNYAWPGNIRELINLVRRAVIMAENPWITLENLGLSSPETPVEQLSLQAAVTRYEARLVSEALVNSKGRVDLTAQALKTTRAVIYHMVKKHSLKHLVYTMVFAFPFCGFIYLTGYHT